MEFVVTKTNHFSSPRICRSPFSYTASPPQVFKLHPSPISFSSIKVKNLHLDNHLFAVSSTTHLNSKPRFKSILCSNSSNALTTDEKSWIEVVGEAISTAFPVWVAVGCLLGLLRPSSYSWVQPKLTVMGITLTMLGMGMTLTFHDLRGALAMPKELFAGFFLQYSIMPLSGYFVSKLLNLPSHYAAGLILVGCCPGGTASNIVTYIARGNVALSVLMTAASTLTAVVMTPFLTAKLAGQYVSVNAVELFMSTLQVTMSSCTSGRSIYLYKHSF